MKPHTIQALRILNERAAESARKKHPSVPSYAIAAKKYRDSTANELTKAVIAWLRLEGHQAERISVTGRVIDCRKTVTDTIGRIRTIGSVTRVRSSMRKGSADISATIYGRSVKVEIKMPGDRQSEDQKAYQAEVEQAGGVYIIVGSFGEFYQWYRVFTTKKAPR